MYNFSQLGQQGLRFLAPLSGTLKQLPVFFGDIRFCLYSCVGPLAWTSLTTRDFVGTGCFRLSPRVTYPPSLRRAREFSRPFVSRRRYRGGHGDLWCWWFFDAVNKISVFGVAVISNLTVCDVCVFHAAVLVEMKLFAVLWFLVWLGDAVFVNLFCGVQDPMSPSL